jgi:hypothetical protein
MAATSAPDQDKIDPEVLKRALILVVIAVPLSTWGLRRFGGKRLWLAALTVFLVGSIGSSLAWNVGSLIAWRVVQGAGAGIMFPLLTTLIMQAAGGRALGEPSPSSRCPPCSARSSARSSAARFSPTSAGGSCSGSTCRSARQASSSPRGSCQQTSPARERHGRAWTWRASPCSPRASRRSSSG